MPRMIAGNNILCDQGSHKDVTRASFAPHLFLPFNFQESSKFLLITLYIIVETKWKSSIMPAAGSV